MASGLELREVRAFLTLAEELHFGRTADRLGITPSRVSQTIRQLEARVGGRLFDRSSRRVALTPAGERLRRDAGAAWEQLEQALAGARSVATGVAGALRLGMYSRCNGGPRFLEIVKTFEQVSGKRVPYEIKPRRLGDIDAYYAATDHAERVMGWRAIRTLDEMCADHWRWQSKNPDGYC